MKPPTLRDFVKAIQKKTYYPINEAKAREWAEAGLLKCYRDPLKPESGWWYPVPKHLEGFMRDSLGLDTQESTEVLKELGLNFRQMELKAPESSKRHVTAV